MKKILKITEVQKNYQQKIVQIVFNFAQGVFVKLPQVNYFKQKLKGLFFRSNRVYIWDFYQKLSQTSLKVSVNQLKCAFKI